MRQFVVSPKWWVGHVLVAAAAALFVLLGIWQYDRSQSVNGDFQNLGYALQWPLFAAFVVAAWSRVLLLEHRRREAPEPPERPQPPQPPHPAPPPPTRPHPVQEDDSDDELAAYNAYLTRLAANDTQR